MNEHEHFLSLIREAAGGTAGGCPPQLPEPQAPPLPAEWEALTSPSLRRKYKAVLFDVYGTLFSSAAGDISVHAADVTARSQALALDRLAALYDTRLCGAELIAFFRGKVGEIHRRSREEGIRWPEVQNDLIWSDFLIERGITGNGQELALRYELAVNPVSVMPGAGEAIAALRQSGCVLGIVSNAQFYTPLLFEALLGGTPREIGFEQDLVIYSYIYGVSKPSPRLYHAAAENLENRGIESGECAFVGNDMLSDIYGAQNAGFRGVLFAGDSRSLRFHEDNELVRGVRPFRIIRKLRHLYSDC